MNAKEIARALRDAECNTELDCEINELRPTLTQAADLIESLTALLTASQRREKAAAEDINLLEDCSVCKHHDLDSCDLAGTKCHFEWRGPQAEEGEAK